ncbi:hypothetical protein [Oleiharenicola sp. Vm1]|uniref:hypothetical protein n=1 Tax=Oleiharenicola sp. Vm1 TaxID=3398393 RepID=UPI0039F501F9
MVTEANNALNLRTAARNVRARLGLPETNQMSYEQRTNYVKELAAEVLKYPQSFTQETLNRAAQTAAKNYAALDNTDFAWGDFVTETANNAKPVLGFTFGILAVVAVLYFTFLASANRPRQAD